MAQTKLLYKLRTGKNRNCELKYMKQTTKNMLRDNFLFILEQKHQAIKENDRWRIANDLSESAHAMMQSHNESISATYNANALELEQVKKQFRDSIEEIDKTAGALIANFRHNGFMKVETNRKTGKSELVGRTTMVDDMVKFLNNMNDLVMRFYQDVYKIEGNSSSEFDVKQTTLF